MRTLLPVVGFVLAACSSSGSSPSIAAPTPGGASDPAAPDTPGAVTPPADNPPGTPGAQGTPGTPKLPSPSGTCPAIVPGDVTFAPAGMPPRKVKLAFDPAQKSAKAPLLFYWHATGSSPDEAAYSLGATEGELTKSGGVVAAPYADPTAGTFEWFIVNQSPKLDDFVLADEIVACLAADGRVDATRIHSMGMSAGALQTTALSFLRSSYIASVATYSGGMPAGFDPPNQDPTNKFAALVFDGGAKDDVFGVDFKAASERYQSTLAAAGHFAALCDHGKGHDIPLDAAPSVVAFFAANPYGAWPSPYASGLPSTFPSYCKR
jgi:poly(3-hydroxybutyrate) depolymerase